MQCRYCNDTGKYKKPNDEAKFDRLIDIEMDKAYPVNYAIAEKKAYDEVGFTVIDCPFCQKNGENK